MTILNSFSPRLLSSVLGVTLSRAKDLQENPHEILKVGDLEKLTAFKPFGGKKKPNPIRTPAAFYPRTEVSKFRLPENIFQLKIEFLNFDRIEFPGPAAKIAVAGKVRLSYLRRVHTFTMNSPKSFTAKGVLEDLFKFADYSIDGRKIPSNTMYDFSYIIDKATKDRRSLRLLFRDKGAENSFIDYEEGEGESEHEYLSEDEGKYEFRYFRNLALFEHREYENIYTPLPEVVYKTPKRVKDSKSRYTTEKFEANIADFIYYVHCVDRGFYSEVSPISGMLEYKTHFGELIATEKPDCNHIVCFDSVKPIDRPFIKIKGFPVFADDIIETTPITKVSGARLESSLDSIPTAEYNRRSCHGNIKVEVKLQK